MIDPQRRTSRRLLLSTGLGAGSILILWVGMLLFVGQAGAAPAPSVLSPEVFSATASYKVLDRVPAAAAVATSTPAARIFLPLVNQAMPPTTEPTATPSPPDSLPRREWDPRLDQRGTVLTEAAVEPGQGYWRLVRAVWYNEEEAQGRHHIFVDVLDAQGRRVVGLPIRFYWAGGDTIVKTQEKAGEVYAADFDMHDIAPSYGAVPVDGHPADDLFGMGLGSIGLPYHTVHTSYGFVWQWTVVPQEQPTATPTATSTQTPTATPVETGAPTSTPTPSVFATTPPNTEPTAAPTTTSTVTPTATPAYLFSRAELVRCDPNAGVTYVQGTVRVAGEPANGYDVVFSYEADGPIVAKTASGPHDGYWGWDPGYYSHILQAGMPRAGDWWFWIVDAWDVRISALAYVHTDGQSGPDTCQQAVIDFDTE